MCKQELQSIEPRGGTKEEQRVFISSVSLERMGNSKGMLLA